MERSNGEIKSIRDSDQRYRIFPRMNEREKLVQESLLGVLRRCGGGENVIDLVEDDEATEKVRERNEKRSGND